MSRGAEAARSERVGVLILAAGASKRMGEPKQLLRVGGKTLLRRAAETALASRCRPVVVVLGAQAARIRGTLDGLPVEVVESREWERGLSRSIRTGLAALRDHPEPADAAVIMLCDQPRVTAALLDELVATRESSHAAIVASAYAGALGVPALFEHSLFAELERLTGDHGARSLIERHGDRVAQVPFPDGAIDVDTPEDVAALRREGD